MKQKLKQTLKPYKKRNIPTSTLNSSPTFRKRPPPKHHGCPCSRPTSGQPRRRMANNGGERPTTAETHNFVNDVTNTNTFSHRIIPESNTGSPVAHHLSCRDHHNNADDHRKLTHQHYTLPKPTSALYTSRNDNVHYRILIFQWQIHSFLFLFYFIVDWFAL